MNVKDRINNINDPSLLDELLQAVDLEHEIEHIDQLSNLEKNTFHIRDVKELRPLSRLKEGDFRKAIRVGTTKNLKEWKHL